MDEGILRQQTGGGPRDDRRRHRGPAEWPVVVVRQRREHSHSRARDRDLRPDVGEVGEELEGIAGAVRRTQEVRLRRRAGRERFSRPSADTAVAAWYAAG